MVSHALLAANVGVAADDGRERLRVRHVPAFDVWIGTGHDDPCLLYTSPSPRDGLLSRMPSSA